MDEQNEGLIYIVWYPVDEDVGHCSGIDSIWATRELAEACALLKDYGGDEPESCVTEWAVWERLP